MNRHMFFATAMLLGGALLPMPAGAQQKTAIIGTGGITGVDFAAGSAICRLVNKERAKYGVRCTAESSAGSVANLRRIAAGEIGFGIVGFHAQYNAVNGTGQFKESGPVTGVRTVLTLYPEVLTFLAGKRSGVARLEDFKGKRFNLGHPGSGTRAAIDTVLSAQGLRYEDFSRVSELRVDEQSAALCDEEIDGFGFTVAHPALNIQQATEICGARLISLGRPLVDKLVAQHPWFSRARIAGGTYPGNPEPVESIGSVAVLVASASVPDSTVYALVASLLENFSEFKRMHPIFGSLEPKGMINAERTAPLHPGALKYYKEQGLL